MKQKTPTRNEHQFRVYVKELEISVELGRILALGVVVLCGVAVLLWVIF